MIRIDGRAIGCGGGFAPNTIIENFKSATLIKKKIPSIQISMGQGNECGGFRSTDYYFENVQVEGLGKILQRRIPNLHLATARHGTKETPVTSRSSCAPAPRHRR
jgi:hypothetical protein